MRGLLVLLKSQWRHLVNTVATKQTENFSPLLSYDRPSRLSHAVKIVEMLVLQGTVVTYKLRCGELFTRALFKTYDTNTAPW